MLVKFKSLHLIVLSILITMTLIACSESKTSSIQNSTGGTSTASTPDTSIKGEPSNSKNINIEQIKASVVSAINDDIWYDGNFSEFKGFEGQISPIEIYINSKSTDHMIYVFFDKPFKVFSQGKDSKKEAYYFIGIDKQEKIDYENKITLSCYRYTKDEATQELKKGGGNTLLLKSDIEFPSASQPLFSPSNSQKEKIIKNIQLKLPDNIKRIYGAQPEKYKVYIRNFRDNDSNTYAVVENSKGKVIIITFDIGNNGNAYESRVYDTTENEILKYRASQFKKVSYEKEIVIGDKDLTSKDQSSVDLLYKSKLGFSLTFPESWKGKYAIEEQGKKLTVIQKHNNKTAKIFEIWTEAESNWKGLTPEKEAYLPVTKICINKGLAFVYYIHDTQPPYMNADDEEKKATEEFNVMLKDMDQIIGSFKII